VAALTNGTQYAFALSAVNAGGESALSSVVMATPQIPAPGAPTNSSATPGNAQATISWATVMGATSYNLYYAAGTTVDKTGTKVSSATSPSIVTTLINGTQYAFAVSAVNAGGESALSSVVMATPQVPAPGAPTISSATPGNAQATISWATVIGATSYNLYYTAGTTVTKTGTKVSGATSPSIVTTLTNGTQYAFAVSAVNAGGESTLSSVVTATPQVPAPGAPTISSANAGNAQVTVTWAAVIGATSYNIYYAIGTTVDKTGTKVTGATSPAVVASLTNGSQYAFAVSAVNAGGESALSTVATAKPQVPAPSAPTLSSPANNALDISITPTLVWNSVANTATYTIQVSNSIAFPVNPIVNVSGVTLTNTIISSGSLSNSTKYYWRVSASNAGGQGPWSAIDSFTTHISWISCNNGLNNFKIMGFAITNGNVFAATDGGVYITSDNGNTWANTGTNGLTNLNISNISANGKNIFVDCGSDGVFQSIDNGAHWSLSQVFPDVVEAITINGTIIFVGTLSNGVYYSANNGANWTHPDNNGLADAYGSVYQIHNLAINGSYLYAGTQGGGIMYSVNNGGSWTEFGQINSGTWINSLGITNGGFYAGTYSDGLYFTQNNGSTWTHVLPNKNVFSIAGSGSKVIATFNQAYSVPPDSVVYSPDNGNTWCNTAVLPVSGDRIESSAIIGNYILLGTGLNGIFRSPLP
jgi:hypothetical protein